IRTTLARSVVSVCQCCRWQAIRTKTVCRHRVLICSRPGFVVTKGGRIMTARSTVIGALVSSALLVSMPTFGADPLSSAEAGFDATKAMLLAYPDSQVKGAQQTLTDEGYYRGLVDGRLDNHTDEAIRRF